LKTFLKNCETKFGVTQQKRKILSVLWFLQQRQKGQSRICCSILHHMTRPGPILRGVQIYLRQSVLARVRIWVISTVTAPNKHISCKSCSSRTRPSVTATMIVNYAASQLLLCPEKKNRKKYGKMQKFTFFCSFVFVFLFSRFLFFFFCKKRRKQTQKQKNKKKRKKICIVLTGYKFC
jgi:hypothetical protein